jgi:hypothetical protein
MFKSYEPFQTFLSNAPFYCDYKEVDKTDFSNDIVFTIQNDFQFILRHLTISYPSLTANQHENEIRAQIFLSSISTNFVPVPLPANLFSSPSEDFNTGVLDQEQTGLFLQSFNFSLMCDRKETLLIRVSGRNTGFTVGALIRGGSIRVRGY